MTGNDLAALLTSGLLAAGVAAQEQKLADVQLPAVEKWMAEAKGAFAFRHAPGRENVAWFVMHRRADPVERTAGHYELAFADRGGGEVRRVDLGDDLCNEEWFAGPVWNADASRIAVAIASTEAAWTKTKVVVVDAKTATAATWLEDVYPASLSWTVDGLWLAVGDGERLRVLKGPADEVWSAVIPEERGWGGGAAAVAPDGGTALAVSARGVFLLTRGVEQAERLGDVSRDATIFTAPQWSRDGRRAVAAAGGGVVLIDLGAKKVHGVGEKELGGRAHAAVWVPGDEHALAFVEQVRDGSAVDVLLGAGHGRQRYSALPVLVSGDAATVLPMPRLGTKTPDPMFTIWFHRPQLSEALSRWAR